MRRYHNRGFTSLGRMLEKFIKSKGLKTGILASKASGIAREFLLEKGMIEYVESIRVKDNILTIACTSPAVAAQIMFMEQSLIEHVNKGLSKGYIKAIHTRT